jgi:hypothetical protein
MRRAWRRKLLAETGQPRRAREGPEPGAVLGLDVLVELFVKKDPQITFAVPFFIFVL